jgi:hypothetical protein
MSSSNFRKRVSKKLLENFNRENSKTVGQAARILLQSAEVKQCIVLKNNETRAVQTGYEAAIGRALTKKEGTKYRAAFKKYIRNISTPFPKDNSPQTKLFFQLVNRQKLTFGKNIFFIPKSFDTIKDSISSFNEDYATKQTSEDTGPYNRSKFGKAVNLDHGADGTASGLVGSVIGAFEVAKDSGKLPKNFKRVFESNLTAVVDNSLNSLTKGQKGKVYAQLMKLVTDGEQIITKGGSLKAGISMILTPVLAEINIVRGSKEEAQIQEAFLSAFEMTFENIDYANLEGSSTLFEKIEKVIVYDNFVKDLKKQKNVKLSLGAKNVKTKTRTKVTEKSKRGKGHSVSKISRGGALATAPAATRTNKASSAEKRRSMFSVMAMINQKLPQTLQKNMREPRLVNRTGRFAGSVRLTDVQETRQGFASFGYTYDKAPYQVFEMGKGRSPWATPERDPRSLIDASIREIAAEMVIGRFYTRRL